MKLERRQIGPSEVEAVHEIMKQCGQDMKERLGLGHWDPPYPLALLRTSAKERRVYAVLTDEQLVATFTVGKEPPSYYHTIAGVWESWDPSGEPALYVNRLAVLPALQGQGIGTWCMQEIEQMASREGYEAIRLDAYGNHLKLVEWYQHLGYHWRGTFVFRTRLYGETCMTCLEKMKEGVTVL